MFEDNTKKYIVIAGFLLVVGLVTYFYFAGRASGKRKKGGDSSKLPNSGSGIPKGWIPDPVVEQLHDAIAGVATDGPTKQQAFAVAYNLTPDQLTAVYNKFNSLYQEGTENDDRNLYNWIKDEWIVGKPLFGNDYHQLLLAKMQQLHLMP